MKKYIPRTKSEFTAMLMQDYGYSEKLAKDCAAIVAGHGGFPDEGKTPIERLMSAAWAVCDFDWSDNDEDAVTSIDNLRDALAEAQAAAKGES